MCWHAPNNTMKYKEQKLIELKEETNIFTIMVEDFNIVLSDSDRLKKENGEYKDLSNK